MVAFISVCFEDRASQAEDEIPWFYFSFKKPSPLLARFTPPGCLHNDFLLVPTTFDITAFDAMTAPSHDSAHGQKPSTIAIAGGGIGGLALAIGLLNRNIPFHVYESAHHFEEIGAGVGFGRNSLHAMTLIDEKIRHGYNKRATFNGYPEKRAVYFDFRWGMDGQGKNAGAKSGDLIDEVKDIEVGLNGIHRAHFLDEMVALVPKEFTSFGKRLEEVEDLEDGVRIHFKDRTTAEASAVVGCDGIKSRTRQLILGEHHEAAHARFTGKYAYRGLIPMEKAVDLLGDEIAKNFQMYLGYHGHILTFPIEKGTIMNVVAFRTKSDGKWEDDKWVIPMKREDMETDFKGWGEQVQEILSLMEKPDVWALFDDPPAPTYYKGKICVLGDSAHASTPHQGAGAGMALEDAFVLSSLLADANNSGDIPKAFKAYDYVRRPRTQKLVTTSRAAGEVYELEGEGTGDDMEAVRRNLDQRYKWVWNKRIEEDLETAKKFMRDDL